jgi:hypothetical protein
MKTITLSAAIEILFGAAAVEVDGTYVRYHHTENETGEDGHVFLNVVTPDPDDPDHTESNLIYDFDERLNQTVEVKDNHILLLNRLTEDLEGDTVMEEVSITPLIPMTL